MAELASSIRLELAQAQDASRFGFEGSNAVQQSKQHHAAQMRAALHQPLCQPVPLEDQVIFEWLHNLMGYQYMRASLMPCLLACGSAWTRSISLHWDY